MRALVVYESMYGNTRDVADAVAGGLVDAGYEVRASEVSAAPTTASDLTTFALVVAGGPTHAFSMSRASTREDAATKGHGPLVSTGIGLREWIGSLETTPGVAVATFDTRVRHPRVPGSAARSARKHLRQQGFRAVDPPTTVHDLHATILHLLGFDHERLTYRYAGRDFRLTDVHGKVLRDVVA